MQQKDVLIILNLKTLGKCSDSRTLYIYRCPTVSQGLDSGHSTYSIWTVCVKGTPLSLFHF